MPPQFTSVPWNTVRKALAHLRPSLTVLLTPKVVLLDRGNKVAPLLMPLADVQGEGAISLDAAVETLLGLMQKNALQGKKIRVLVADTWLKHVHFPFAVASARTEDVQILLQNHYRKVYSDMAAHWQLSWDIRDGQLWAAAMPQQPLLALQKGLAQQANVLQSVQPMTPYIADQLLTDQATTWFVLQGSLSVSVVFIAQGVWQHWVALPAIQGAQNSHSMLLLREAARLQITCQNVTIVPVGDVQSAKILSQELQGLGWRVTLATHQSHNPTVVMRWMRAMAQESSA